MVAVVPKTVRRDGVDVTPGVILGHVAAVFSVMDEERGAEWRPRPHRAVIVFRGAARPRRTAVGGLDQARMERGLPQPGIAAVLAIHVARHERVEHRVDALLAARFPGRAVLFLPARLAVGVHGIDERAGELEGAGSAQAIETEVSGLFAESPAVAVKGVQVVIVGPEWVPRVPVGVVPLVRLIQFGYYLDDRPLPHAPKGDPGGCLEETAPAESLHHREWYRTSARRPKATMPGAALVIRRRTPARRGRRAGAGFRLQALTDNATGGTAFVLVCR